MHVMHLMHHPIQAERQETKYAEDHTIEFIQTTALSQQTMRGLGKANQQPVHEMGGHQHERQPPPTAPTPRGRPGQSQPLQTTPQSATSVKASENTRVWNATQLTSCFLCSSGTPSAVVAIFAISVCQDGCSPLRHAANVFHHCPE